MRSEASEAGARTARPTCAPVILAATATTSSWVRIFRRFATPIDTSTPQGMFSLQVLGAVAQLERVLISERTKAGLKALRARGRG